MREPAVEDAICSCCGNQFGYDDFDTSHSELRRRWIASGCRWWSDHTKPPAGWDPEAQLDRLAATAKR